MISKPFLPLAAALSAALFSAAFVPVAHAQAKPALTRDIDRPSAQPINGTCNASFTVPNAIIKCTLYTVLAGKRLIVEMVSYDLPVQSGSQIYSLTFGQDGGFSSLPIGLPNVVAVAPSLVYEERDVREYSGSQLVQLSLDENQKLAASDQHGGNVNYVQFFSFFGYLVDK